MTGIDFAALSSAAFLAAVWLGYPAIMWAGARMRRPRPVPANGPAPTVSVIIATRDATEAIRARIANVADSETPIAEVIVARDAQAAALPAAALEGEGWSGVAVRVVPGDGPGGKAGALNAGVRAAAGDILVFADTHQRFERGTIRALLDGLADARVGIVSGALELPPSAPGVVRRYWSYERALRRNEARVHSAIGVTGAVYAMRRDLWQPLPAALILDDVYTPMRLILEGHRVGFAPGGVARETRAPSPGQEYSRKVRTLTGVMQLCAWLPAILVPYRNPVWLQFTFHKLLRMLTPYAAAVLGVWLVAAAVRLPLPALAGLAAAIAGALVIVGLARPRLLGRLRAVAAEGFLLQAAVVVAGVNGLRGRWQVWDA